MTFRQTFWRIFVRSLAAVPLCWPPPSAWFYCYYRPPEVGRSPAGLWSVVWRGASLNTEWLLVLGCGECRGWRVRSRAWSLAVSKWSVGAAMNWQVCETGRLYSAVIHHTRSTLHVPGSSYLDIVGLSLLVRKWGPLYLTRSVKCPVLAGSFRVKWSYRKYWFNFDRPSNKIQHLVRLYL